LWNPRLPRPCGRRTRPEARRYAVTADLEARIRRLEDRVQISEQVIRYAMAVDRRDWAMLGRCFTEPVHADFTEFGKRMARS